MGESMKTSKTLFFLRTMLALAMLVALNTDIHTLRAATQALTQANVSPGVPTDSMSAIVNAAMRYQASDSVRSNISQLTQQAYAGIADLSTKLKTQETTETNTFLKQIYQNIQNLLQTVQSQSFLNYLDERDRVRTKNLNPTERDFALKQVRAKYQTVADQALVQWHSILVAFSTLATYELATDIIGKGSERIMVQNIANLVTPLLQIFDLFIK